MKDDLRINGVSITAHPGDESGADGSRTVRLPSGKEARIRRGRGRDLMRAQRATEGSDPGAVVFALIAELAEVNGQQIVYEDVLTMDLADVLTLQAEVAGENFPLPPPPASQVLSASDSRSAS